MNVIKNLNNNLNKTLNGIYSEYCSHRGKDSLNDTNNIIAWHILFVIITPIFLYTHYGFKSFRYYLPLIDLCAAGFVYIGSKHFKTSEDPTRKEHYFNGLYELIPKNTLSYVSSNIINLLALAGVAIHSILWAENKGVLTGIGVAIVMYLVTYLMPSLLLPTIIDTVTEKIDKYVLNDLIKKNKYLKKGRIIEEFVLSVGIIALLLVFEGYMIKTLILEE
jgi:hypothetical protein